MRAKWAIGLGCAVTGALISLSIPALACGVSERPIQQVRLDPQGELRAEATRLDAAAMQNERAAQVQEREASRLSDESRLIRQEANRVSEVTRRELIALATNLAMRANQALRVARDDRAEATDLRAQARLLRDRANRLAGGGGGWGIRRPVDQREISL